VNTNARAADEAFIREPEDIFVDMYLRQFYDPSLAQASYLIGCQATGDAIVIDPLRDVDAYITVAQAEGLRISYVTETHIHADFVSGSRELAARSGATLCLSAEGGADWQYAFAEHDGAHLLRDGDRIAVGNINLDVMHTPGHTPEHLSFVVTDTPSGVGPIGVVTGDFVFVGDVGRPDLLEKAAHVADTMEASARTLFASLARFRTLPDHLQVWPGHGAGSACGKALGAIPSSTVGYEKLANWGVIERDEDAFVRVVLDGQPDPPRYFAEMKRINREGPVVLGSMPIPRALPASDVIDSARDGGWLIDLRDAPAFGAAFVPGALSIPFTRSFSTWAGWLVPYDVEVTLLVPDAGSTHVGGAELAERAARELVMIGLDRVRGWCSSDGAIAAWVAQGTSAAVIPQVDVAALADGLARESLHALDVRAESEWSAGHLTGVTNVPLGHLMTSTSALPESPIVVHCQSGARSAIAASVLYRLGHRDVRNLTGGYQAWVRAGFAVER